MYSTEVNIYIISKKKIANTFLRSLHSCLEIKKEAIPDGSILHAQLKRPIFRPAIFPKRDNSEEKAISIRSTPLEVGVILGLETSPLFHLLTSDIRKLMEVSMTFKSILYLRHSMM